MTWISTKEKLPEYGKPILIKANGTTQHVTYMRDGDDFSDDWFEPYHFEHEDDLKLPVGKVDYWQYVENI